MAPNPGDLGAFRELIREHTMAQYLERNGWAEETAANRSSRSLAMSVCEWLLSKPQPDPRISRPLEYWEQGIIRFVASEICTAARECSFELPGWMRERIDATREKADRVTI